MASNVIKCKSCNIVICEVLAFIQNKQNVMKTDSLVKVCRSSFSSEEIKNAKILLFDSLTNKKRRIQRRNVGETERDLNDVISLFRKTDPEELPIFVAKDLHCLPPVNFDHIDCSRLLKDILILKNDISRIKETYVTERQLNDIKNEVLNLKQASLINSFFDVNINRKRGGGGIKDSLYLDSDPNGLSPFEKTIISSSPNSSNVTADKPEPMADAYGSKPFQSLSPTRKSQTPERQQQCSGKGKEKTPYNQMFLAARKSESKLHAKQDVGVWSKLPTEAGITCTDGGTVNEDQSGNNWKLVKQETRKNRLTVAEGKAAIRPDGNFKADEKSIPANRQAVLPWYRRRNKKVIVKNWTQKVTIEKPQSEAGDLVLPIVKIEKQRLTQVGIIGNDTTLMSEYRMRENTEWEIPRSKISLTEQVLGEGEFGKVVKAEAHGIVAEDAKTVVAIKMLKASADKISLVSEMEIMKLIGKHENIINLLGCCTQDGPLYVVMEYAENGSLRDYLRQHKPQKSNASTENLLKKPLTQRELMDFVWQVVKGMAYLASRGFIHRDLAARNVLVSANMVLKIADFGLARDVRESGCYECGTPGVIDLVSVKLPVKWMAPESIEKLYFDKRSDVWSFGILLWEIMTYGCTPYPKVHSNYLCQYLKNGKRMEKPDNCSKDMYDMMMGCWAFEPKDRPTFEDLVEKMNTILNIEINPPMPDGEEHYYAYLTMLG